MSAQKRKISVRERGIAVLLVTAMSIVVFPMVGLSIDAGLLFVVRAKLSSAADAAAVAGGRSLRRGSDITTQTANAQTTAQNYFRANFPSAFLLTTNSSITTDVSQQNGYRQVVTSVTASVPVTFMRVLPNVGPTINVNVSATAHRRDTNLVLVLDRSGSLASSGSCDPMKAAAAGYVQMFAEQRDYVGMVTFASSSYYMDYPLSTNFKSSSPSLATAISNISCVGYTGSAQGLWNGYTALANLNQPGALNVIVFFTDGQPTAVTAEFPIKANCLVKTPKLGVLAVGGSNPYGLMNVSNGPTPIANDNILQILDKGCAFYPNHPNNVDQDVSYIPDSDYYGDNLKSGYMPVTLGNWGPGSGHISVTASNIKNVVVNAVDEAAKHIRNGDAITKVTPGAPAAAVGKKLANVVIFSIGLGNSTDPPNADLLKRVANDPGSSIYDSTKAEGLYIYAQSASDLNDAFSRVASEVLRLAK